MQVGAEGIKKLYGYDEPLPRTVLSALNGGPVPPITYDEGLIWTRNAIAFLVKFGQVDQGYVHTVSLKSLLARLTGISRGRISLVECGHSQLNEDEQCRAERALRVAIRDRYENFKSIVERISGPAGDGER